jgi:hypothetical protein
MPPIPIQTLPNTRRFYQPKRGGMVNNPLPGQMKNPLAIEIAGLTKAYGEVQALRDPGLSWPEWRGLTLGSHPFGVPPLTPELTPKMHRRKGHDVRAFSWTLARDSRHRRPLWESSESRGVSQAIRQPNSRRGPASDKRRRG